MTAGNNAESDDEVNESDFKRVEVDEDLDNENESETQI